MNRLYIRCDDGLANRLRVLISGLYLSQKTHREMNLIWKKNSACGCKFKDLFAYKNIKHFRVRTLSPLYHVKKIDLLVNNLTKEGLIKIIKDTKIKKVYFRGCNNWLLEPKESFEDKKNLIEEYLKIFKELKLRDEIVKEINNFYENNFKNRSVLGVHIRKSDFIKHHPKSRDNLEIFKREVKNYLNKNPNTIIFVATDDGFKDYQTNEKKYEGVIENLKKEFGEKIIYRKKIKMERDNKEAIRDALIDLLLLRKTDFLIGTENSSFTGLALLGKNGIKV